MSDVIHVGRLPHRKQKALIVETPDELEILAYFKNDEAADRFLDLMRHASKVGLFVDREFPGQETGSQLPDSPDAAAPGVARERSLVLDPENQDEPLSWADSVSGGR